MNDLLIKSNDIETFQKDGVILVKGLFSNFVDTISAGIERNLSYPSKYAAENLTDNEPGRFFDDYCNWQRIPEFREVIFNSAAGRVAAKLMKSKTVKLFHEHILIKEPGTTKPTPWHQDSPYYFVEGKKTISFWSPIDKVTSASLRCVKGSHRWEKAVLPKKWLKEDDFYKTNSSFIPAPNPDLEEIDIKE